jgi:predicted metalloprotease
MESILQAIICKPEVVHFQMGGVMQWAGGRRSGNIEDRRGIGPIGIGGLGGLGGLVVLLIALFFGVDPRALMDNSTEAPANVARPADDQTKDFISAVLGYTEDTWSDIFQRNGRTYREPKLVLFTGSVSSACGFAQAAMGPFYCPSDEKVYLDTSFFQELRDRFHAPGDFAQAYVIAHEVGHHVQNLLGITEQAERRGSNETSVRVELQADCLSGVFADHNRGVLDPGDIDEALGAASMIGDDRLQMQARGYVVPESFTHGTAEQRSRWFRTGFEKGDVSACDTFRVRTP